MNGEIAVVRTDIDGYEDELRDLLVANHRTPGISRIRGETPFVPYRI